MVSVYEQRRLGNVVFLPAQVWWTARHCLSIPQKGRREALKRLWLLLCRKLSRKSENWGADSDLGYALAFHHLVSHFSSILREARSPECEVKKAWFTSPSAVDELCVSGKGHFTCLSPRFFISKSGFQYLPPTVDVRIGGYMCTVSAGTICSRSDCHHYSCFYHPDSETETYWGMDPTQPSGPFPSFWISASHMWQLHRRPHTCFREEKNTLPGFDCFL